MLLDFPNEILLLIAENLHEADINSLATVPYTAFWTPFSTATMFIILRAEHEH
ncbi:hypothetical protein AWENTII_009071 [Aspergillus wentii]